MAALEKMFPSQEACLDYLASLRWPAPHGFKCPQCQDGKAWRTGNGLWLCAGCRRQQSVLAGTVFQDTHLPVQTWFRAMWHICADKNGMSAQNLQRLLGMRSYNTAWLCLHKLRRAMVRPGRDRLSGTVEADECYAGGPKEGGRGRGAFGRQTVFVAAEVRGRKIGRIRLLRIPDVSGKTLEGAVSGAIAEGSAVRTDGWGGYNGIAGLGCRREIAAPDDTGLADIALPKCHLVVSLLKRWVPGTLQGNVGAEHLQDYLNGFTFRFNRRTSKSRGLLFYRLAELSVVTGPAPRASIVPSKGDG
jgi:hypothetical protein